MTSSVFRDPQCKISAAAVKLLGAGALLLCGCARPALVTVEEDVASDRALVLFSLRMTSGRAPVHITVGRDEVFLSELKERDFIFGSGGSAGLDADTVHAFAVPAGDVRIAVTRIGDFWEFAGGTVEHVLAAEAQRAYYLGALELEFAEDSDATGMVFFDDAPPAAGTQPLGVDTRPPPSRTLACGVKVVDEEPAARAVLRERFAAFEPALVNRAGDWRRVLRSGLRIDKTTTPVGVERQP